jgi:large subunit ribosomal protein L2
VIEMGKNLIQQARGKGGPTYRAPSFRYRGATRYIEYEQQQRKGVIMDLINCPGHSAPLALVNYEEKKRFIIAPEGVRVGDAVSAGPESEISVGNTIALKEIPEGTLVFNIESQPGDGGKFCRASGAFARVIGKIGNRVIVQLPSKKKKEFQAHCRATVGVAAGSGRKEKPLLKAGKRFHAMKARNKLYPLVSGGAQNAVDHPFGNKRSSRKAKARPAPRHAPPGRNVGLLHPKRTGRRKK